MLHLQVVTGLVCSYSLDECEVFSIGFVLYYITVADPGFWKGKERLGYLRVEPHTLNCFAVRRCASACLSVRLCVCHESQFYQNG